MMNSITLPVVKGDILFVNDMALMHARQGFDEGGVYMKRHLIKMFFRDPEKDWAIPPLLMEERMKMYGPNRPDGTRQETWNIYHKAGLEENSPMNGWVGGLPGRIRHYEIDVGDEYYDLACLSCHEVSKYPSSSCGLPSFIAFLILTIQGALVSFAVIWVAGVGRGMRCRWSRTCTEQSAITLSLVLGSADLSDGRIA